VYTALRLAGEVLDAAIPPELFRRLQHEPADEAIVAVARSFVLAPSVELPRAYLELALVPGLRERWAQTARYIFLPQETMERLYGPQGNALGRGFGYVRRVIDLLGRQGRTLLKFVLGTKAVHSALQREDRRLVIDGWVRRGVARQSADGSFVEREHPLNDD